MDWILGTIVRGLIALLQALPLEWAARVGRCLGATAWVVDRRHRGVAIANITATLGPELGPDGVLRVARENFRRIGENYVCALRTAVMDDAEMVGRLEVTGLGEVLPSDGSSLVVAIPHCGNFELFARVGRLAPSWTLAATYRQLRQPVLNGLMMSLRAMSGVRFFERTRDGRLLREAMGRGKLVLGLLSDQHAGDKGLWIPFLGRDCSTIVAPAVYAAIVRYGTPLCTAVCVRTGLARWRIEFGPRIPTHGPDGSPRDPAAIMMDVNRALEVAVLRDPANWFWVHRRWKPRSSSQRQAHPDDAQPTPTP